MKSCLRFVVCAIVALCSTGLVQAQTEIRFWPGGARGSEDWSIPESVTVSPAGDRVITNVSDPTLTVYLPDASLATGAAAVIAPGGALRVLGFDNEGVKVAEWLNQRGIAGFVLKYRTLQQDASAPRDPLPGTPAPGSARRSPRKPTRRPTSSSPSMGHRCRTSMCRHMRRRCSWPSALRTST